MESRKKIFRTLGIILFYAGILAGMVTFILMNWAYFEAYFYFGYTAPADKSLTNLRCPLLLTAEEEGQVTASITNNADRDLTIPVRTEFSYYGASTLDKVTYPVAMGQTQNLSWTVTKDNMVFGHLILARVFVYSSFTLPSRSATCGTVVVGLPGVTGIELFIIVLVFSLASMAAGWGLWIAGNRLVLVDGLIATRAMTFFTIAVVLGLIAGVIGWWGLGLICTVACVLLIITVGGYYIQKA
jgi:hypothetical protein